MAKAIPSRATIPYLKLMLDHGYVTPSILHYQYAGSGTEADPYVVGWVDDDPRNPMIVPNSRKWLWTFLESITTLAVALTTSAYSGAPKEIMGGLGGSREIYEFGFSVYVLGFALGPLIWGPLSEIYGRQILFFTTLGAFAALNAGSIAAPNIGALIVLRFAKASFGSSVLSNAGAVIADIYPASERGLGIVAFSSGPLLGPVLGPVIGGWLGERAGWRWIEGFLTILSGTLWILVCLIVPETYAPVLLQKRAQRLAKLTGKHFVSKIEKEHSPKRLGKTLATALIRPWVLLIWEPIVLLIAVYMAILYGTLYMFFAAFPIVYQQHRGWGEGIGGLAFLGIGVGVILGVLYSIPDHRRYLAARKAAHEDLDPERRLPAALVGSIAIPISIFWFAWTNSPAIHFIVPMIAEIPFGFGFVLVFLSTQNYLVDAYTIYAASVLAANTLLRSLIGAAFPLFTAYMYENLGIHWASSIPAFLALACVPFPFLFYRYGTRIRRRCKYAAEAEKVRKLVVD